VAKPLPPRYRAACAFSFNHLIGAGEQRGRNGQAKRFGSLEVDYQLVVGCSIGIWLGFSPTMILLT
jgi:hypothetical protein